MLRNLIEWVWTFIHSQKIRSSQRISVLCLAKLKWLGATKCSNYTCQEREQILPTRLLAWWAKTISQVSEQMQLHTSASSSRTALESGRAETDRTLLIHWFFLLHSVGFWREIGEKNIDFACMWQGAGYARLPISHLAGSQFPFWNILVLY